MKLPWVQDTEPIKTYEYESVVVRKGTDPDCTHDIIRVGLGDAFRVGWLTTSTRECLTCGELVADCSRPTTWGEPA